MDAGAKRRARLAATAVVGAGNAAMAGLGLVDRLQFTVPTNLEFLALAANNTLWIWLLSASALATWASVLYNRWHVPATAAATGVIGAWSFLNLLWGLNSVRPVSLAGPVLGTVVTALGYILTWLWARSDEHAKGR